MHPKKEDVNPNYKFLLKSPDKSAPSKNDTSKSISMKIEQGSQVNRGVKVQSSHGSGPSSTFIHCNSMEPYEPYLPKMNSTQVNETLNLHLGLPTDPREILIIRKICVLLSNLLSFVETHLFKIMDQIPLKLRQYVTMKAWSLFLPIHRATLSNKTGIHKNVSFEYHALSTIMYWGRLFPQSIRRIRFSLSQMPVWHGPEVYPAVTPDVYASGSRFRTWGYGRGGRLEKKQVKDIYYEGGRNEVKMIKKLSIRESDLPVTGFYIPNVNARENDEDDNTDKESSSNGKKVMFYLYGGAFLGGDAKGQLLYATKLSKRCGLDVFVPSYRLLPEYHFLDALEDVIRSYSYLIEVRGIKPENVIMFGISSGGGLIVRLLQRLAEVRKNDLKAGADAGTLPLSPGVEITMPRGAVLMCPFVEYTEPQGSFKNYKVHDLIVNDAVYEEGVPYFSTQGDEEFMFSLSPVNRPMAGMPPLCLVVSEHECVYDQNIKLCNRAREAGVKVDLGVWKYMCHVWPVLSAFLPEARSAVDFMCDWIVEKNK